MELSKHYKLGADELVKRPATEAPRQIQVVYGCCLAIQVMIARGEKMKVMVARRIMEAQVKINRAALKLIQGDLS